MAITDDKDSNMKDDTFVLCGHSCFVPGVRRYVTLLYLCLTYVKVLRHCMLNLRISRTKLNKL
ncbi:hypothetical protein BLOT_016638 [Blomia tropicalis]|nr:hypothetical protein BLOT_016638 [Blomia tropicalis]